MIVKRPVYFLLAFLAILVSLNQEEWSERFSETDTDKNDFLTKEEILEVVRKADRKSALREAESIISTYDKDGDGKLNLNEYKDYAQSHNTHQNPEFDQKIFELADADNDKRLSSTELVSTLLPHANTQINDLIIQQSFDELDSSGDKKISVNEYYSNVLFQIDDDEAITDQDKEHFKKHLDKNNDGFIDISEYKKIYSDEDELGDSSWVNEIFEKADSNHDGKLTKDEFKKNFPSISHLFEVPDEDEDYDHEEL